MKKHLYIIIVMALSLVLMLSGCSKTDQPANSPVNNTGNAQENINTGNINVSDNTNNTGVSGSEKSNESENTNNASENAGTNNNAVNTVDKQDNSANNAENTGDNTNNANNTEVSGNGADNKSDNDSNNINNAENTGNTENNNSADNTNNTENTDNAENTGNNAENTNSAENTNNAENASDNTNSAQNTNNAENTSDNTNSAENDDAVVKKEIIGTWYDQYSYGEIKIEKNGDCTYKTYAGDFSGTVTASENESNHGLYQFDLKIEGSYEEYPNLFYDKENDVLYYDSGGQTNLFAHDPHPYEPIDWVYGMFGEDLLQYYPDHFEYKEKTTEYTRVILFDSIRNVEDLCILSVSLTGFDGKGDPVYLCEILYTMEEYEAGKGLAVWMDFPGDTPSNGIMYTDPISGEVRKYTISLSGMDGSLILTEFH